MSSVSELDSIGLVLCSDRKGGLENAFVDMAYALVTLGYKVVALTPANAQFRSMMPELVEFYDYSPKGYWDFLVVLKHGVISRITISSCWLPSIQEPLIRLQNLFPV